VSFAPLVPVIFAKLKRVSKIRLYKIGHWNSPRAGRRAAFARSSRGRPDPRAKVFRRGLKRKAARCDAAAANNA
jgi:hypothetical protein